MIVEHYAFRNCSSLIEIDCSKCDESIFFGIIFEEHVNQNLSIIIPDKLADNWPGNCGFYTQFFRKSSEKIQRKIEQIKNFKIIQACYHIYKSYDYLDDKTKKLLKQLTDNLISKYNITKEDYSYFEYLQEKKEKIKNGKEI